MGSADQLMLHGGAQIWRKRDFRNLKTTSGIIGGGALSLFNPILTIVGLPREIDLFPRDDRGPGPKSDAPHVKDFTNLDGVLRNS
ncbi:hypothetical protein Tco_0875092 [Tanacetum coccineum]|uniref:Uncharacterized protein n=1 Tax=Tanacetum coccineum TaxID=301880 RepID=A0ABQ5BNH2_9ASTR